MITKDKMTDIITRIKNLEGEKDLLSDDIKEVYAEAKGLGVDTKILRSVISLLRKDPDDRKDLIDGVDEILVLIGEA